MTSKEQKPGTTLVERLREREAQCRRLAYPDHPPIFVELAGEFAEARSALLALEGERDAQREARAEIAALVPDDADPGDDTDNQAGFRNAIEQALHLIDAALSSSEHI
jgi:hypothetical protein